MKSMEKKKSSRASKKPSENSQSGLRRKTSATNKTERESNTGAISNDAAEIQGPRKAEKHSLDDDSDLEGDEELLLLDTAIQAIKTDFTGNVPESSEEFDAPISDRLQKQSFMSFAGRQSVSEVTRVSRSSEAGAANDVTENPRKWSTASTPFRPSLIRPTLGGEMKVRPALGSFDDSLKVDNTGRKSTVQPDNRASQVPNVDGIETSSGKDLSDVVDNPWKWSRTSTPLRSSLIRPTLGGELAVKEPSIASASSVPGIMDDVREPNAGSIRPDKETGSMAPRASRASESVPAARDAKLSSTSVENPWKWSRTSTPLNRSMIRETLGGDLTAEPRGTFLPKRTAASTSILELKQPSQNSAKNSTSERTSRLNTNYGTRASKTNERRSTSSVADSRQSGSYKDATASVSSGAADPTPKSSLTASRPSGAATLSDEPIVRKSLAVPRTVGGAGDAADTLGNAPGKQSINNSDTFRKTFGLASFGGTSVEAATLSSQFLTEAPVDRSHKSTVMPITVQPDAAPGMISLPDTKGEISQRTVRRSSTATGEPIEVKTEIRRTTEQFADSNGQVYNNYEPAEVVRVRKNTKTYSDEQSTDPIEEMELRKTSKKFVNPAGSQLFEIQLKKNVRRSKSNNTRQPVPVSDPLDTKPRSKSVGDDDTDEDNLADRVLSVTKPGKDKSKVKKSKTGKKKGKRKADDESEEDEEMGSPKKKQKGKKQGKGDGLDTDENDLTDYSTKPKEREPSFLSWLLGKNKKKPKKGAKKKAVKGGEDWDEKLPLKKAEERTGTSGPSCEQELAYVKKQAEEAKAAAERAEAELKKLTQKRGISPGLGLGSLTSPGPVCRLGKRKTVSEIHERADQQYDTCALPVGRLKPEHPSPKGRQLTSEERECEFRRQKEECERAGGTWLPLCGAEEPSVCDPEAQIAEVRDRIMMKLSEIQCVLNETCSLRQEAEQMCDILREKRCCYDELAAKHAKLNGMLAREFAHKDEVLMEMDDCETLLLRLECGEPDVCVLPPPERPDLDYRDHYMYHMQQLAHEEFGVLTGYTQLHDEMLYDKIDVLKIWHQLTQDYLEETQCLTDSQQKARQAFTAATTKYKRIKTMRDQLSCEFICLQEQTQQEICLATMEDQKERQEDQDRLAKYRDQLQRCCITRDLKYESVLEAKDCLVSCMKEKIQCLYTSHIALDAAGMDAIKTFDDLVDVGREMRLSHETMKLLAALPPETDYADHLERIQKILAEYVQCMKEIEARREDLLRQRTELVGLPDPLASGDGQDPSEQSCQCPCPVE